MEGLTELHLHSAPWQAGAPPTAPPTLCNLSAKLHRSSTQGHYTAAYEFCKISGLLCSYGNLMQEVRDNILATFCRGPTCSFSVQVVVQDSQGSRESAGLWAQQGAVEYIQLCVVHYGLPPLPSPPLPAPLLVAVAFVSCCFSGQDEWRRTINRLSQDVL